jgi:LysR family hydrogen peroxide-inducible transcriptional activator
MVDNGLGTTLLPTLGVDAGVLLGTSLVTRSLLGDESARKIGLVWRKKHLAAHSNSLPSDPNSQSES